MQRVNFNLVCEEKCSQEVEYKSFNDDGYGFKKRCFKIIENDVYTIYIIIIFYININI